MKYKIDKNVMSRPEGKEEMLLFHPERRSVHILSDLAYECWKSCDEEGGLERFMEKHSLSGDEIEGFIESMLSRGLIYAT